MKDKEKQIEEMLKLMCEEYGKECGECPCGGTCANELQAERLYENGYRKLPEYSVVLTKEELKNMVNMSNVQIKCITDIAINARKETAEKILFKFESAFAYYDNEDMFSKKAIFECLEEIVKSLGVEIGDK